MRLPNMSRHWFHHYEDYQIKPYNDWEQEQYSIVQNINESEGAQAVVDYVKEEITTHPNEPFLWHVGSAFLGNQKHFENAHFFAKRALGLSEAVEYRYNVAISAMHMGDFELALNSAQSLAEEYPRARILLIVLLVNNEDWQQAAYHLWRSDNSLWNYYIHFRQLVLTLSLATNIDFDHGYKLAPYDDPNLMFRMLNQYRATPQNVDYIIFFACDFAYLKRYAPQYITSIVRTHTTANYLIHFHLYEASEEGETYARQLAARYPDKVVWTKENDRFFDTPYNNYYNCARFWILWCLMQTYKCPVFSTDVDSLLRNDPWPLIKANRQHSLWGLQCGQAPMWDTYGAGSAVYYPTQSTEKFLRYVSTFLAENISRHHPEFFLDQMALYLAHNAGILHPGEAKFEGFFPTMCDINFHEDSIFWAAAGERKDDDTNAFAQYGRECLSEYVLEPA